MEEAGGEVEGGGGGEGEGEGGEGCEEGDGGEGCEEGEGAVIWGTMRVADGWCWALWYGKVAVIVRRGRCVEVPVRGRRFPGISRTWAVTLGY